MEPAELFNVVPMLVGAAVMALDAEEEEIEQAMLQVARIAVAEIIELEEEFDENVGNIWVPVTVVIDDYHMMGDPCFKLHFRMNRGTFEVLAATVHTHLRNQGRIRRERRPFQDILLMVIWLLATPDSFRSVALRFGVAPSSLYYFYGYVIEALREMARRFIKWPGAEERLQIATTFQRATGFPGVVGCIDGTHVTINAPVRDPAHFVNRHHSYSINVQAVVDSTLLVRDVHVGEPGSMNDKRVFRRSPLYQKLSQGNGISLPDEHIVGDGGYTLTDYMLIPFLNDGHTTPAQRNFNKRLSQSRVRVENSFAKAKGKWRCLKFLHARNQSVVVDHITACFTTLHNFLILNGEVMLEEEDLARDIHENQVIENHDENDEEREGDEEDEMLLAAKRRGGEKKDCNYGTSTATCIVILIC